MQREREREREIVRISVPDQYLIVNVKSSLSYYFLLVITKLRKQLNKSVRIKDSSIINCVYQNIKITK